MNTLHQALSELRERAADQIDWNGDTYQTIRVDYWAEYFIDIEFTFELERVEIDGYKFMEAELDSVFIYEAFRNEDDETTTDITDLVRKELQFECKNIY